MAGTDCQNVVVPVVDVVGHHVAVVSSLLSLFSWCLWLSSCLVGCILQSLPQIFSLSFFTFLVLLFSVVSFLAPQMVQWSLVVTGEGGCVVGCR